MDSLVAAVRAGPVTIGRLVAASAGVLLINCGCGPAGPQGWAGHDWNRVVPETATNKGVRAHYTFEDAGGANGAVANVAGEGSKLEFVAQEVWTLVPCHGRYDSKRAVRLDRGTLEGDPIDIENRVFSLELWFRPLAKGAIPGPSDPNAGTLVCVGNGVWNGWRLTMRYPEQVLRFELGRPKPLRAIGAETEAPVAAGVWHRAVATWDGESIYLYVDGLLEALEPYDGPYTPAPRESKFRVGFVGNGLGSVRFDVDEVVIYDRALSEREVLRGADFEEDSPNGIVDAMCELNRQFLDDPAGPVSEQFRALYRDPNVSRRLAGMAGIRWAQCLASRGESRAAFDELCRMAATQGLWMTHCWTAASRALAMRENGVGADASPEQFERILSACDVLPEGERSARLQLARAYRHEKDYASARTQYEGILALRELPRRTRLDVLLEAMGTCLEAGDRASVRRYGGFITEDTDAPVQYSAFARFVMSESCIAEEEYSSAMAECEKVAKDGRFPAHLRWEAGERIKAIDRVAHGLPPVDPMATRTRLPPRETPGKSFYVSSEGDDAAPGTESQPFATLERARDAIRRIKKVTGLPAGGVDVVLRGGEYPFRRTFELNSEDSGSPDSPIWYRAARGETPRLSGGVQLEGFQAVTDRGVHARLPECSRERVMQVNLASCGVTDIPPLVPIGFGTRISPIMELYWDGRPMALARWPNKGSVTTGEILADGTNQIKANIAFRYCNARVERWQESRDIWLHGYWAYLWADLSLQIAQIDRSKGCIITAEPSRYPAREGQPYYYFNVLEELDSPGEWFVDRTSGVLYFYPPGEIAEHEIEVSALNTLLVEACDVTDVVFKGLTFEFARGLGFAISGGSRCSVLDCTFSGIAGDAIVVKGGKDHAVLGCDIRNVGRTAVGLIGGDRRTLDPAGHVVENCHITNFARIHRGESPAVRIDGVGSRLAHSVIHNGPCQAIRLAGNDHVVEYNEIHNVVLESDDMGGLDMCDNDPSYRGNIIRYNYWHDIGNGHPWGQAAIRLDCAVSGTAIYGNVFRNCSGGGFGAVHINKGKDNWVDNNVFIDCRRAVGFFLMGEERWRQFLASELVQGKLHGRVDISHVTYRAKYPELASLDGAPTVNAVWRNVVCACPEFLRGDGGMQDLCGNTVVCESVWLASGVMPDALPSVFARAPDMPSFRDIPFAWIGPRGDAATPSP